MLDHSVAVAMQGRNATAVLVLRGLLDVGLQCGRSHAGEECYAVLVYQGTTRCWTTVWP